MLLLLAAGCGLTLHGELDGDVPEGSRALLLWYSDVALGIPGAEAPVDGRELRLHVPPDPPEDPGGIPPEAWWAFVVVVDPELELVSPLPPEAVDHVLAAWPHGFVHHQHLLVRYNGLKRPDPAFPSGLSCGGCEDPDTCAPGPCDDLVLEVGDPLAADWTVPLGAGVTAVGPAGGPLAYAHATPERLQAVYRVLPGEPRELVYAVDDAGLTVDGVTGYHPDTDRLAVRWSRDSGWIRSFGVVRGGARAWEVEDERTPWLAPDGRTVAVADDAGVELLDAATGELLHEVRGADARFAWSPDGRFLFVGPEGEVPAAVDLSGDAEPSAWPACAGLPAPTADVCDGERANHFWLDPFAQPRPDPEAPCEDRRYADIAWVADPVAWEACR